MGLDTLTILVAFLEPFYEAQKELEGDKYPTLNLVLLWIEKLRRHCYPKVNDSAQQAAVRKRHEEWLARKVIIDDRHKVATFLWPKFNQLRMMSASERARVYDHVRALLLSMPAPAAPDTDGDEAWPGPEDGGDWQPAGTPPPEENVFAEWENEDNLLECQQVSLPQTDNVS